MTKRKHLKRRIRERSAKTGESYSAARRYLQAPAEEATNMMTTKTRTFTAECSFCRKSNDQVKKLIAGPGVYICDECISLCNNILGEELAGTEADEHRALPLDDRPIEGLMVIFAGMNETARSINRNILVWATALHERGASPGRLGAAAGITEAEAKERFGL